jgi:hypothetical protein
LQRLTSNGEALVTATQWCNRFKHLRPARPFFG